MSEQQDSGDECDCDDGDYQEISDWMDQNGEWFRHILRVQDKYQREYREREHREERPDHPIPLPIAIFPGDSIASFNKGETPAVRPKPVEDFY